MTAAAATAMTQEQDRRIAEAVARERGRLRDFIRRRLPDPRDGEDLLQDVLIEFVEEYRLMRPIEPAGAWLYRVARKHYAVRHLRQRLAASAMRNRFVRMAGIAVLVVLVLTRILFGGLGRRGGHGHWRSRWRKRWHERWHERWEQMSPEEREKFRAGMGARCGDWRSEPKSG
ncbi:MAG TPA: sigma factor [Steroidobacteraceae bacterium]|nr:sigma factor [Steroidobacteraceae bacterium]